MDAYELRLEGAAGERLDGRVLMSAQTVEDLIDEAGEAAFRSRSTASGLSISTSKYLAQRLHDALAELERLRAEVAALAAAMPRERLRAEAAEAKVEQLRTRIGWLYSA
jgi:hypothetical protein